MGGGNRDRCWGGSKDASSAVCAGSGQFQSTGTNGHRRTRGHHAPAHSSTLGAAPVSVPSIQVWKQPKCMHAMYHYVTRIKSFSSPPSEACSNACIPFLRTWVSSTIHRKPPIACSKNSQFSLCTRWSPPSPKHGILPPLLGPTNTTDNRWRHPPHRINISDYIRPITRTQHPHLRS